jgi:hypothetical protein
VSRDSEFVSCNVIEEEVSRDSEFVSCNVIEEEVSRDSEFVSCNVRHDHGSGNDLRGDGRNVVDAGR